MELTMSNGLCEMSVNEILLLDGGEWSWSDFGVILELQQQVIV